MVDGIAAESRDQVSRLVRDGGARDGCLLATVASTKSEVMAWMGEIILYELRVWGSEVR